MARKITKTSKTSTPAAKPRATKQAVPKSAAKQAAANPIVQKSKPKTATMSVIEVQTAAPRPSAVGATGKAPQSVSVESRPRPAPVGTKTALATEAPSPPTPKPRAAAEKGVSAEVLAKAEADITAAIDSLNQQMNSAITTLTALAVAQRGQTEAVVRTMPLDRATAMFQRLVSEVVDEQLAEMLPPLVSLRNEITHRARQDGSRDSVADDFHHRGAELLDQVLAGAGVSRYEVRLGVSFDPVIHLAVGETHRDDLADGVVSEAFQPGFRTARGKVISPAKVKVNRR